jgi:hypothetical protein
MNDAYYNRLVAGFVLCGVPWTTAEAFVRQSSVGNLDATLILEALRAGWPEGVARLAAASEMVEGPPSVAETGALVQLYWEAYAYLCSSIVLRELRQIGAWWEECVREIATALNTLLASWREALDSFAALSEVQCEIRRSSPMRIAPRVILGACTLARASPRRAARWSPLYGVRG